jgi:hypothetical protein
MESDIEYNDLEFDGAMISPVVLKGCYSIMSVMGYIDFNLVQTSIPLSFTGPGETGSRYRS